MLIVCQSSCSVCYAIDVEPLFNIQDTAAYYFIIFVKQVRDEVERAVCSCLNTPNTSRLALEVDCPF